MLQITPLQFFACQREGLGKKQAGHKAGEFVVLTFLVQTDPKEGAVTKTFNFSFSTTVGHHNLKYVVIVVLVVVVVIIVIIVVVVNSSNSCKVAHNLNVDHGSEHEVDCGGDHESSKREK